MLRVLEKDDLQNDIRQGAALSSLPVLLQAAAINRLEKAEAALAQNDGDDATQMVTGAMAFLYGAHSSLMRNGFSAFLSFLFSFFFFVVLILEKPCVPIG